MNTFVKQLHTRHPKVKSDKPKILWLLNDWWANAYRQANDLYGGIGYYRVVAPARTLRKWFDIEIVGAEFKHWGTTEETYTRLGRDYDLIYSKHLTNGETASNILAASKHFKRKVIVDIDDNYFGIEKDNPAFKDYGPQTEGRGFVGAFLELADGITVSTDPLKQVYKKLNKSIDVLPNCVDLSDWSEPVKKDDGLIRIGYAGGIAHNADLDLIVEPIGRILEKYPNVVFEVLGALTPEKAREMGGKMLKFANHKILERFKITGGTQAWLGYPELLASMGWDIGIAPLTDNAFNRGKSHIKWMEYSLVGAATVASPVYPYCEPINKLDTIVHGKTGLLANTVEEWTQCLETLIRNPDMRVNMAKKANEYVRDNWTYDKWAILWKKTISKYL